MKKDGGPIDVSALRPVKQFKWLLDATQKVTFAQWLRLAVPVHVAFAPAIKGCETQEKKDKSIVLASTSIAASSSSAGVATTAMKKGKKVVQERSADAKSILLAKFFNKAI